MVDVLFYKGVLYPLPLDAECQNGDPESRVPSLLQLSAECIVQDAASTSRALDVIPSELYYNLMRAALHHFRDRSIELLIAHWPWSSMSLRKLAPPLFGDIKALYDDNYISQQMRRGVKYTTCLAHTFVECLKKRSPTQLKYLDMTGFPAAEVIVNYLSSHVLLVFNEARQREIITMYNEVTADLPDNQRQKYNIDTTLPDETFVISMDAYIQNGEPHMELCRALKTAKFEPCRFRLQVQSLDLSCLGVARISVLLEQVDPKCLRQLCIQYNAISNGGLIILAPAIQRLTSLTCLDLSCNNIFITYRDDIGILLGGMLAQLPLLQRLNLNNNRLKNKLYRLLSPLQRPLLYLSLCGCGLSQQDLEYLTRCQHAPFLQELDLSENYLANSQPPQLLPNLVQSLTDLRRLDVEDTELTDSDMPLLVSSLQNSRKLLYLNFSRNADLRSALVEQSLQSLVKMPALKAVKLSYPPDVYLECDISDNDSEHQYKRCFKMRMKLMLHVLCKENNRPDIHVILLDL